MKPHQRPKAWTLFAVLCLIAPAVQASFHLMQIEQVAGGVCSDASSQAVQLRMRAGGQNLVSGARLIAHDATGSNPVELISFPSNVANNAGGSRILVTSSAFSTDNPVTADFTMSELIPESYLAAGRLTFESSGGTIYWSVSWGGTAYTGSTTGATTNDADGDFGPSFATALPSSGSHALQFQGAFSDVSTSNAADYAVTADEAEFVNNAGSSGTVIPCSIFSDDFESGDVLSWSSSVG